MFLFLETVNFRGNTHHPTIFFHTTTCSKHDGAAMLAQRGHMTQGSFGFALLPYFLGSEVTLTQGLPDHEGDSGVLIATCEGI